MKNTTDPEIALPALVIEKEGCPICAVIEAYKFQLPANLQRDIGEQDELQNQISSQSLFYNYHYHKLLSISNR